MGVPEVGVSEEGVCYLLPVKFQDMKIKDPKFKHVRIDMKHSYFSKLIYDIHACMSFIYVDMHLKISCGKLFNIIP